MKPLAITTVLVSVNLLQPSWLYKIIKTPFFETLLKVMKVKDWYYKYLPWWSYDGIKTVILKIPFCIRKLLMKMCKCGNNKSHFWWHFCPYTCIIYLLDFCYQEGTHPVLYGRGKYPPPPPPKKIPPFISLVKESIIFIFKLQFCILNMFPTLFCLHCT